MGGHIDAYLDCTSPYSYFALLRLRRIRPIFNSYDITVTVRPVFLGGINVGSGNKPPWTLPAKAAYGKFDLRRTIQHFRVDPNFSSPSFFPILSVGVQRAMLAVQDRHEAEMFEKCFLSTWEWTFLKHVDISKLENLKAMLAEHFDEKEVEEVMRLMGTKPYKEKLTKNTEEALAKGAFGAPWFWMRNVEGKEEPLFGSDRFAYMYRFMGMDFEDLRPLEKGKAKL